ncbi:MAG: DEAD/DEAH box helicase, partial [Pelagibacterales bacterium]|nr:DEAD/DEAH box helicase [Pelagibacterales bacterium]
KFQFYETEDQLETIKEVLKDINSEQPMDRLVCGDVGFGKTEVAMRAAFIAIKSDSQVAVIAPTTILARQHYDTFKKRFAGEKVTISHLSRLTSEKDKRNVINGLKDGKIDIIIGTHSLLSDKIIFKNLCLFVVDEEQRFGVAQKERLKNITNNAHILTLTATPIPRTLHMALSGIRDLSIIASAPDNRLPVRSFVVPFNEFNIKEGIQREIHRGGQVYCIVPRIKDIKAFHNKIIDFVDNATISIVHGKMPGKDIEDTMMKFYGGISNILIATSIIENGLDIPNANTIFIYKADMFGLGQLYQLKGRVGRSDKRAYAYFLLSNNKKMTINAEKRLHAIQSLEGLGAGFSLAAHDLDIRGAGNLLGDEQSGQIKEVGISLYQQLLNEAVSDIKGEKYIINDFIPQINLQAPALIPENYILDLSLRLQIYRRLGNIKDYNEFELFIIELIDRFGPIPKELNYLIRVLKIKRNCIKTGIQRIDSGINGATIEFINEGYINPEKFIIWLHSYKIDLKVRSDKKIGLFYKWSSIDERLDIIEDLTSEIAKLLIN